MYWQFSRYSRSSVQSCWARFKYEYPRITPDPEFVDAPESAPLRCLHFLIFGAFAGAYRQESRMKRVLQGNAGIAFVAPDGRKQAMPRRSARALPHYSAAVRAAASGS